MLTFGPGRHPLAPCWDSSPGTWCPLKDPDMVSFDPKRSPVIRGLEGVRRGPAHGLPGRDGTTWQWSISHFTSEDYRVGYATTPSPTGPVHQPRTDPREGPRPGCQGPGHGSMLRIPGTDRWYYAYHRFAIPSGDSTHREVTLDRVPVTPEAVRRIAPTSPG
ncbi:family 43 glycosylhydrolase [Pseudonocardia sp. MCCB 268]|nr:family 43 glycosylhydrolase [Pseudonocardia cytotoxica]